MSGEALVNVADGTDGVNSVLMIGIGDGISADIV